MSRGRDSLGTGGAGLAWIEKESRGEAMLHWWLIPLLVALAVVLWGFYALIKHQGGTGVRTEGRTLVDKPDEDNPPLE